MQYVFCKDLSLVTICHNLLTAKDISRRKFSLQIITPGCHAADVMSQDINSSHRKHLTYSALHAAVMSDE